MDDGVRFDGFELVLNRLDDKLSAAVRFLSPLVSYTSSQGDGLTCPGNDRVIPFLIGSNNPIRVTPLELELHLSPI
jgi:hypothetical protein